MTTPLTPTPAPELTRHASDRIRQRGMREEDVELIRDFGTPTREGTVLFRKNANHVERQAKALVRRLGKRES